MTRREIKRLMKAKGITQGDIRRRWKAPKATVSAAVNRKFASQKWNRRLAKSLGIAEEEITGNRAPTKEVTQ